MRVPLPNLGPHFFCCSKETLWETNTLAASKRGKMFVPSPSGGFTMTRLTATILALVIFGSGANAQPRGRPGGQLPLSPGVVPGSPIGPGMQFLQRPGQGFNAPPVGAPPNNGF